MSRSRLNGRAGPSRPSARGTMTWSGIRFETATCTTCNSDPTKKVVRVVQLSLPSWVRCVNLHPFPPNHPGELGGTGYCFRSFGRWYATVGVVFPAHKLPSDSGYLGPQPSILPCCRGAHALRGPLFFWLGSKVLIFYGNRPPRRFVVLKPIKQLAPTQILYWMISF